jgi:hypothetical protein
LGADLTGSERAFVARALRRRRLFLALSIVGLVVAVGLGGYYTWRKLHDPASAVGARMVIVVLVLLNSRQNLRQYRFAGILEKLEP